MQIAYIHLEEKGNYDDEERKMRKIYLILFTFIFHYANMKGSRLIC